MLPPVLLPMLKRVLLCLVVLLVIAIAVSVYVVWRYPMAVFNTLNRHALASAGFVKVRVPSPAGEQTVLRAGSGPVVILLHGLGDQAGTWSKTAGSLTATHTVVAVDLAGHGESQPQTGPLDMGTLLAGLDSVVGASSQGKPVILVGNSLGGFLAFVYARQHPERVSRIVVIGGGPLRGHSQLSLQPNTREEALKLFDALLDPGSPRPAGFVLDDIIREAHNGPIARLAANGVAAFEPYLMDGKLADFNTPVDLLWGESDRMVPLEYAKALHEQLPASRLTTLLRCGHVPQQECPKAFSGALRQILSSPPPARQEPPKP